MSGPTFGAPFQIRTLPTPVIIRAICGISASCPAHLHPLACRVGRAERASVVAFAHRQGMSVSGLLKTALRQYLAAQPDLQPVHAGVNKGLSDPPMLAALIQPHRLPRQPGMRASAALRRGTGERKGMLSDTAR